MLHLLKSEISTPIIWNSFAEEICLFPSIYLFIQSFIYLSIWTIPFYALGYNPT